MKEATNEFLQFGRLEGKAANESFAGAGTALDNFMIGKNSAAVTEFFRDVRVKAQKAGEAIAEGVDKKRKEGIASNVAKVDNIETLKKDKEMESWMERMQKLADKFREKFASPLDKFKTQAQEIIQLWKDKCLNENELTSYLDKLKNESGLKPEVKTKNSFQAVDTSLINVRGLQGEKTTEIKSKQLDTVIDILKKNARVSAPNGYAIAG